MLRDGQFSAYVAGYLLDKIKPIFPAPNAAAGEACNTSSATITRYSAEDEIVVLRPMVT